MLTCSINHTPFYFTPVSTYGTFSNHNKTQDIDMAEVPYQ